jgi:histone-lysine N-methyltransferase SETMAR
VLFHFIYNLPIPTNIFDFLKIFKDMPSRGELRTLLYYCFQRGLKTKQATQEINGAKGEGTVSRWTANRWYRKFRSGQTELEDQPRSGRPPTTNDQAILRSVENQPDLSVRKREQSIRTSKSTIHRHLHCHGFKPKIGRWIPHRLTPAHLQQRVTACQQLLTLQQRKRILSKLITVDETWVHHDGTVRRINWLREGQVAQGVPKPNPLGHKVMLIVFWAKFGIVHWELIPRDVGLNSDRYCTILNQVQVAARLFTAQGVRRGKVFLQQDNAPPHRAQSTQSHIKDVLGWDLLPHPPYSPDIAPSDYHLFRSLKYHLRGVQFQNDVEVENWLQNFFGSKMGTKFYKRGIQKLHRKWEEVINNNGQYIVT